jgi:branched-chain amino acid transport system ATP-binding protein
MIKVEGIEVSYGEINVLNDVSLEVGEGEVVAVIGSNGAGKTTLLKAIAGLQGPKKGRILYNGMRLDRLATHKIVRLGVAYIPAERELFPQMTVRENLELGAYATTANKTQGEQFKFVFDLFPRLKERQGQFVGTLSGGEQQMVAIGRGLMSKPKVLLLDEPSTGLAPLLVAEIYQRLHRLREEGLIILLAEQQVSLALSLAHRAYVLENGQIRRHGNSKDLLEDSEVKEAYLGIA